MVSNYFKGKVSVGMFVTMNATQEFYDKMYKKEFEHYMDEFGKLNGDVVLYPCYNTLQVSDYSKFNMSSFDEEVKRKRTMNYFLWIYKMHIILDPN